MNLKLGYTSELIEAGKKKSLLRNQLAYLLATAYHETAHTMKPVAEAYWVKDAEIWRKKNLRYWPWYGRGYVQLTWEENYKKASLKLGVDLVKNKELALDKKIAADIAVLGMIEGWFAGDKEGRHNLARYITLQKSDFKGARRIINGKDEAALIASYAEDYDVDLWKIGYGEESTPKEVSVVKEVPVVIEVPVAKEVPTHIVVDDPGVPVPKKPEPSPWASLFALIASLFFKGK